MQTRGYATAAAAGIGTKNNIPPNPWWGDIIINEIESVYKNMVFSI